VLDATPAAYLELEIPSHRSHARRGGEADGPIVRRHAQAFRFDHVCERAPGSCCDRKGTSGGGPSAWSLARRKTCLLRSDDVIGHDLELPSSRWKRNSGFQHLLMGDRHPPFAQLTRDGELHRLLRRNVAHCRMQESVRRPIVECTTFEGATKRTIKRLAMRRGTYCTADAGASTSLRPRVLTVAQASAAWSCRKCRSTVPNRRGRGMGGKMLAIGKEGTDIVAARIVRDEHKRRSADAA